MGVRTLHTEYKGSVANAVLTHFYNMPGYEAVMKYMSNSMTNYNASHYGIYLRELNTCGYVLMYQMQKNFLVICFIFDVLFSLFLTRTACTVGFSFFFVLFCFCLFV